MEKNNVPEKSESFARKVIDVDPESESKQDDVGVGVGVGVDVDAVVESDHSEKKNEDRDETEEGKNQDEEIHCTLETVSIDMDQFLSSLVIPDDDNGESDVKSSLEIPDSVYKFLDLVEAEIMKYDSGEDRAKLWQVAEEESSLFEAVDRISKLISLLAKSKLESKYEYVINRIEGIQHRAMSFFEDEFSTILESREGESNPSGGDAKGKQDPESCVAESESAEEDYFPGYSDEIISNLSKIASKMVSGGYEFECCQIYVISRRNAFEESFSKLGFEKNSFDDVQKMPWESLEREIATWIKTFKYCSTVYFAKELKLAAAIFAGSPSIVNTLLSNFTRIVVIQLINFAEAITVTKRSSEKLFKFLDMYETLRECGPAMEGLFDNACANELLGEITLARRRIGETVILIFCELETSIKSDTAKTQVPGGAVHPLTRYTMNYLKYACEYKDTLEQLFKEHCKIERTDSTDRSEFDSNNQTETESPFQIQLIRVMDLLDVNLEAKSKLYKDTSLSSIFLMNNGRYILQKIKGSPEIHALMGNTWCRKRSSDIRNYHKAYKRETLSRLLGCLSHEGLMVNGKVVKPVLKERFKSFNAMFDEIHRTQSTWVVSDEQLQSELRVSISAVVIPAYRSFLGRFSQHLDPGRQTEKYVKFQAEDIETYIEELFDGNASPMAKRRI